MQQAIEGARALLPLVEDEPGEQPRPVRDALSQLQMAYAQRPSGQPPDAPAGDAAQAPPAADPEQPEGPGPAQTSRPALGARSVAAHAAVPR